MDVSNKYALLENAALGCTDTVEQLLREGANIETRARDDNSTVLIVASSNGHNDIVKILLDHMRRNQKRSHFIESKDSIGLTALMHAAMKGHEEVVETLLADGANREAENDDGWTALSYASLKGHTRIVDRLRNCSNEHKLRSASYVDDALFTKFPSLKNDIAAINDQQEEGETLLSISARHNNVPEITILLKAGADVEARDQDGSTPLIKAALHGSRQAYDALLCAGANIDAADCQGRTAQTLLTTTRPPGFIFQEPVIEAYRPDSAIESTDWLQ